MQGRTNSINHISKELLLPGEVSQLKYFSDKELEELQKKHKKDLDQLRQILIQHPWVYNAHAIQNICFLVDDCLYTPFQILTGKDGTQSTVDFFDPKVPVSDAVGYAVSTVLAIPDFIFNMTAIHPYKEAVKSTLEYQPLSDQLRKFFNGISESFSTAWNEGVCGVTKVIFNGVTASVKSVFHHSILWTHNITGAATNAIALYEAAGPIPVIMNYIPRPGQYAIVGSICYFGNGYYSKYSNPDYYEGLDFWFGDDQGNSSIAALKKGQISTAMTRIFNNHGILSDIRHLELSRAFQVFFQAHISTVALRAFPGFYYVAVALEQDLGYWMSPTAVAALVAFHTEMVRAPVTYKRYHGAEQELEKLLENEGGDINDKKLALKNVVHQRHGYFGIFAKEPTKSAVAGTASVILLSGAAGGYYGATVLLPQLIGYIANEPLCETLSILLGASVPLLLSYQAEKNRIINNVALEDYKKEQARADVEAANQPANHNSETIFTGADAFAAIMVLGSQLGRAFSTIGSAARLNMNPAVTQLTTLIALQNAVNGFFFNFNKVKSTVSSWSIFKPKENNVEVEGDRPSICCFRNRRR